MYKEKKMTVSVVLVASLLFIRCAVAVDETPDRVSIAEIVSGIEESSQIYHREMMELQTLFDISPEAQEAFQKAKNVETALHYSYTSTGEFTWSTESWAGGTNVLSQLSIIQGSHNARKRRYLEKLVAADDRFEIFDSGQHLHGAALSYLVMRGSWSVSMYDDDALLQRLLLLNQK